LGDVSVELFNPYEIVIWQTGNKEVGLNEDDRNAVQNYIENGGRFFLSGEHVIRETASEANTWIWLNLRVAYRNTEEGGPSVEGVEGDPVSDGLMLGLLDGDGADNFYEPDVIEPAYGSDQCFSYDTDSGAGVRAEFGEAKVLTLGFGFESINAAADRNQLMQQIVQWMVPAHTGVNANLPLPVTLHQNVPNPFNPRTEIQFSLASKQRIKLSVYDMAGKRVVELADVVYEKGDHFVSWNGLDSTGRAMSSGTYLVRLETESGVEARKMSLIR
jgi:hypothetical protein